MDLSVGRTDRRECSVPHQRSDITNSWFERQNVGSEGRPLQPALLSHWNATHLLRAGMPRDYMQWLRGDAMREAIDIYNHIDPKDVRKSYLAHVPQLGV